MHRSRLRSLFGGSGGSEPTERFFLNLSNFTGGGSITKAQGTCTIDQVGILHPVISVNRSSGVAPLGVVFNATTTQVLPSMAEFPFHELSYSWEFGDAAGGATWGYGTKPGVASKNIAYGPVAGHCFETDGTYTVTLYVMHISAGGVITTRSTTTTITVTNADTVFAGANTICVANGTLPVAGVDGVPAGALCYNESNWATVTSYQTSGKRVLLKRGDAWTGSGGSVSSQTLGYFGAYGTGAKPQLTLDANAMGIYINNSHDLRIVDLSITSSLSAGSSLRGIRSYGNSTNTLVLRCDITHTQYAIEGDGADGFVVADCNIHDLNATDNGIGLYHHTVNNLAVLGSRFSGIPANHGIRIQGVDVGVISNNQVDGASGHQITVRGMQDAVEGTWTGTWTQHAVISDNVADATNSSPDLAAIYTGPVNLAHAERLRDVIIERNLVISSHSANILVGVAHRATVRNNICKVTEYSYSIAIGGNIGLLSLPPDSTWIYNNTVHKPDALTVDDFSAVYIGSGGAYAQATGSVIKNNLAYAPGNIHDADQTIGVTTGTFLCATNVPGGDYTMSNNSSNAQVNATQPWAAAIPTVAIDYTPSNYGIDGGTYVPIGEDYFNQQITGTREIGAIQV